MDSKTNSKPRAAPNGARKSSKANGQSDENLVDKLREIEAALSAEKQKAQDYFNQLLSVTADFENFRKRTLDGARRLREDGRIEVLEGVVPLIDILEQAVSMVADDATKKGLQMVVKNFLTSLEKVGVSEIVPMAEEFDARMHNAISSEKVSDSSLKNKVVEVVKKGYKLGERIIRYADVKVGK